MSGQEYDALVKEEAVAARHRYESERAVQAKREDLLVPLSKPMPVEVESGQVSTTTTTPK